MPLFDGFFACDAPTFLPVIPLESGIQRTAIWIPDSAFQPLDRKGGSHSLYASSG